MVDAEVTSFEPFQASVAAVVVDALPAERWEVYYRLQSLGIPCQYRTGEPLTVWLESPLNVVQYWCALRQLRGTRAELVEWLQNCWQAE